jgi:hypothetical protein
MRRIRFQGQELVVVPSRSVSARALLYRPEDVDAEGQPKRGPSGAPFMSFAIVGLDGQVWRYGEMLGTDAEFETVPSAPVAAQEAA